MKQKLGFYGWLKKQRKRDDPIGDIARDAMEDRDFPRRAKSLTVYVDYLEDINACGDAISALHTCWQEYQVYKYGPKPIPKPFTKKIKMSATVH